MPWGNRSTDHNQRGLTRQERATTNSTQRRINQEATRRVQQERPATNQDGNKGTR